MVLDSALVSPPTDDLSPQFLAALSSFQQATAVEQPVSLITNNSLFAFTDSLSADPFAPSANTPSALNSGIALAAPQSGDGGGITSLVSFSASSATSPPPSGGSMSPPVVPPPTMPPLAIQDIYPVGQGTFTVGASAGVLTNDTNPTGQPMSAVLVSTTTHGVLSLGTDGSLAYTASAGYTGIDSFSYKVTAGGLTSNTATDYFYVANTGTGNNPPAFTWTQSLPTVPTVTNPGNKTSAEGQAISLAVQASGTGLQYAAVNLPTGLGINATTGVISGTLDYAAAENFGGTYASTVIVAGSNGGSTTQQFTWAVTDTLRPPVLTNPGSQSSNTGEPVSLQLVGSSPDGDGLMYTAVGLPSGLLFDGETGTISGSIDHSASTSKQ